MLSVKRTIVTSPQASQTHSRQPSTTSKQPPPTSSRVPSSEAKLREKPVYPVSDRSGDVGTVRAKKPLTVYDEAVQKVQEWNEALNGEYLQESR